MKCSFTFNIEHPAMDGEAFNQSIAETLRGFAKLLDTSVVPAIGEAVAGDHKARLSWAFTTKETHQ